MRYRCSLTAIIRPTIGRMAIHDVPRGLVAAALMNVAKEFEEDAALSLDEFSERATV